MHGVSNWYDKPGNPNWVKGCKSENPAGRPLGNLDSKKVKKRTQEALTAFAEFVVATDITGKTAVDLLMEFASDDDIPHALRIFATLSQKWRSIDCRTVSSRSSRASS
jgi:hypothetical protein